MAYPASLPQRRARSGFPLIDKLGVLLVLIMAAGWIFFPFAIVRPNRIVPGQPLRVFDALPPIEALVLAVVLGIGLAVAFYRTSNLWRLLAAFAGLAALLMLIGRAATYLTPAGNTFARISPGAGFWLLLLGFALFATDALTRLRLRPWPRILALLLVAAGLAAILMSGLWKDISILKEYQTNARTFWREAQTHVFLAFGSVIIATVIGLPLGILCHRVGVLRAVVLNVLNIVQTIPSIALFGLLIAPLAWLGANSELAAAIGIAGIGPAPAMVALIAYSLLPVVANTVVGLSNVPASANDAARGMGMTDGQRLFGVELPLAFPVILTGIRIVLVQNIGLATIAFLIGGGGLGAFVFLGVSQTAADLVLLGAVPTVALAFAAAIILDAFVEMVQA